MFKHNFLSLTFIFFLSISNIPVTAFCDTQSINNPGPISANDTIKENQVLYNGRVWRNRFYNIRGDQFLYTKEFLPGSVTMGDTTFTNLNMRYDIFSDEIMIPSNHGLILQLNKELVDSYTLIFQDKNYLFTNVTSDSLRGLKGYVNVLYKGKSAFYVKYKKEIELLAIEKKYDAFFQTHKLYFVTDSVAYQISGKGEFLGLLGEDKQQVKNFIKKNRIKVSRSTPESFIPVIQFYDSLKK